MRLPLLCVDCVQAKLPPHECTVLVTPNETGIYDVTCAAGHRTLTALAATRHEQLFELGLSAISDEYFREAVSSFSAALERFYEFCTRVLAASAGVDPDEFGTAWKSLSRQSERQLGAFVAAYLIVEKSTPKVLAAKEAEFRNDVIHKGRFPTRAEAQKFGDDVLAVVRPALRLLKSRHESALHSQWQRHLEEALHSSQARGRIVNRHYPTMTLRNLDLDETEGRNTEFYVWVLRARHGLLSGAR